MSRFQTPRTALRAAPSQPRAHQQARGRCLPRVLRRAALAALLLLPWTGGAGLDAQATTFPQRITKTGPASVVAGDIFTYTITVRATTRARQNIVVVDSLPAAGSLISTVPAGIVSGRTITWNIPTLTVGGAPAVFTVTYQAPPAPATLVNTAVLAAAQPNLDAPERAAVTTEVLAPPPSADLKITKSAPASVASGAALRYSLTFENLGKDPALAVSIRDQLPPQGSFLSASNGGTESNGVVSWPNIPQLAPGASATYTVDFRAPVGPATLVNMATVGSPTPDPDLSNNESTATTEVRPPIDVSVTKSGPNRVLSSAVFDYTIVVRNVGGAPTAAVQVTDRLPSGGTFISAVPAATPQSGVLTWSPIPTLAVGASQSFTVTYRAPNGPATLTNTAIVSTPGDSDSLNDTSSVVTEVSPVPTADVRITKSAPTSVPSEGVFQYTLLVENLGLAPALGVTVEDQLPTAGRFIGASNGGTAAGGVVSWPLIPVLAPGASLTYTVDFQAPTGPQTLVNTGVVASTTSDPDTTNNRSSVTTEVEPPPSEIDVAVRKIGPSQVSTGQVFTYSLLVQNVGSSTAASVTVTDQLPPNGTFISASGSGTAAGGVVTWNIPSLAARGSQTFTVNFRADSAGTLLNSARVSTPGDTNPANDTSSVATLVELKAGADLEVVKTGPATVAVGSNANYRIVVRNLGPDPALDVVVADTLPDPAFALFVSASPAEQPHGPDPPFITWPTIPTLAAGDSAVFAVTLNLPTLVTVLDIATVASTTPDPDSTNNADTASTRTTIGPGETDLTLLKEVDRPEATIGDIVQYRLIVAANEVFDSVRVRDVLPVGFRYVAGTTRINGSAVADPAPEGGRILEFAPFPGPSLAQTTITYRARIGPDAVTGDGINRAVATADALRRDAQARVRLAGVFSDEGLIVGTVFMNCGCDETQNPGELGIPGVRLYLQDGTAAITDSEGKYNFYGLRPRTWVVRVDRSTLPAGARMIPLTNRHGNDGHSAFVDLKRGELHRADFASDSTRISAEVERRRANPEVVAGIPTAGDRGATGQPVGAFRPVLPESVLDDRNTNLPAAPGLLEVPVGGGLRADAPQAGSLVSDTTDLVLTVGSGGYRADGASKVPVTVRHHQAQAALVTLESSAGHWMVMDTDSVQPGVQVMVPAAGAAFSLVAPDQPARARIRASLDQARFTSTELVFAPRLSPLTAVGLLEARIDLRTLTDGELGLGRSRDRFEDRLTGIDWNSDDGDIFGGARAAAFVNGEVGDDFEVTVRLDSEENPDVRLFRDIQPDAFYPAYGDASLAQYGAQSTGRFFGQLRRGASALTYGDFVTAPAAFGAVGARALGAYSRTLNGAIQHFENERVSFDAFASRDRTTQVVDEIVARGVSGPYALTRNDARINSERVELVTRDRNQPGVVLRTESLERFTDYTIEPFTGRLLFRRPVPSVDEELNPIVIRVAYEVESGGDDFWVYGGFGQIKPVDRLELGGGWVRDDAPAARYDLATVNGTLDLGAGTYLIGEFAQSDQSGGTPASGNGTRFEVQHGSDRLSARLFFLETDTAFVNPSAAFGIGRREYGVRSLARLNDRTQLFGEWLHTESLLQAGGEREGGRVAIDRALGEWMRGRVGFRWSTETDLAAVPGSPSTPDAVNAIGAQLTARLPFLPKGSLFSEFEQDVADSDQRRLALGGDYRILDRARLYGRHELISSLSGPYGLSSLQERNTTVFGIASDYGRGASIFSEYRARDALEGRQSQAAIGLRNQWTVAPGVRINTGLERVSPLGSTATAATALTGGLELTQDSLWKATARAEYYATDGVDNVLGSLGYARKINSDVTFLGSTVFNTMLDGDRAFERTRLGFAYRETEQNRWNALGRYEHRYERNPDFDGVENIRAAHIFAAHVNYQPDENLILRAQWASKFASDETAGVRETDRAHLLGARGTLDVTDRLDLGVIGRALFASAYETVQFGFGAEVGVLLADNLRLAGGYNAFGFRDRELSREEYTDKGFYLQLGFKFDETLFGRGEPDRGPVTTGPCACVPDLAVDIARDEGASSDTLGVYVVTTTNVGGVAVDSVETVVDVGALTVIRASHLAQALDHQITWAWPHLGPAEFHRDTLVVRPICPTGNDTLRARATTRTPEPDTTNNTDSESAALSASHAGCVQPPLDTTDIAVKIDGPDSVPAGSEATFVITVANVRPGSVADGVVLQTTIPQELEIVRSVPIEFKNGLTPFSLGAITFPDSAVHILVLRCDPARSGTFTLRAEVETTSDEANVGNNSAGRVSKTVTCTPADTTDIEVHVRAPATAVAGTPFAHQITVTTLGPASAHDVTLTATVTPEGVPAAPRPGASVSRGKIDWAVIAPVLEAGKADARHVVEFNVPACAGWNGRNVMTNALTATSSSQSRTDNDSGSGRTRIIDPQDCTPQADIRVRVRPIGNTAFADSLLWFRVTTWNAGGASAEDVTLQAVVPGTVRRPANLTQRPGYSGQTTYEGVSLRSAEERNDTVRWMAHPQPLAAGDSIVDWLAVMVPCLDPGAGSLSFDIPVSVGTRTSESDYGNNSHAAARDMAIACPTPPPPPPLDTTDVRVGIAVVGPRVVRPGDSLRLLLRSTNVDTVRALRVLRSVPRPGGVAFLRGSAARPQSAIILGDTIVWAPSLTGLAGGRRDGDLLVPGESREDTLFLRAPDQVGPFTVATLIRIANPERRYDNNRDTVSILVSDVPLADLSIQIVPVILDQCRPDEPWTVFHIITTNRGNAPATNVVRTIERPDGVDFPLPRGSAGRVERSMLTWPALATLPASSSWVDTVRVHFPNQTDTIPLLARVTSTPRDADDANNQGEIVVITQDTVRVAGCCDNTCLICLWPPSSWWWWLLLLLLAFSATAWALYRRRRYGRIFIPCFRPWTIFRRKSIRQTVSELRKQENRTVERIRTHHDRVGAQPCADWDVTIELAHAYRDVRAWPRIYTLMETMPPALARKPIMRRLYAFALHRDKQSEKAEFELRRLLERQGPRPTTLGMLGRIYKDRWEEAHTCNADGAPAKRDLELAIDTYRQGHASDPTNPYPGVNALTLAEFLPAAPSWRDDLLAQVKQAAQSWVNEFDYWIYATRAEIAALDRDPVGLQTALADAFKTRHVIWQVETTARNLGLIEAAREQRGETVPEWLTTVVSNLKARVEAEGA